MKRIFVGNLDFDTTEDQLKAAFEPHGKVSSASIVTDRDTAKPRGFAFVEMEDDQQAEAAITALNGTQLGSRQINVNEARPKTERGGGGGGFGRDKRPGGGYGGNKRGGGGGGGGGRW